jgi:hypothetical protein
MDSFGQNLRKFLKSVEFLSVETTRESFETLLKLFPNLEEMLIRSLAILDPVENPSEIELKRLRKLTLLGYPAMTQLSDLQKECLVGYLKQWKTLESVSASYEYSMALKEISKVQNNLKHITTFGSFDWNLLDNLQLENLEVKYLENIDEFVLSLRNQEALKYLDFTVNIMSVTNLQNLFEHVLSKRSLEVFSIKSNFGFPELQDFAFFSNLTSNLKQLRIVDVNCLNISKREFIEPLLKACPNLEKLYLLLPVIGLPMATRRVYTFNYILRRNNEFASRLLKVVQKQNQPWVYKKNITPPELLAPNRNFLKDFQFWYYEKALDIILNEDVIRNFSDLEILLIFVSSFSELSRIVDSYKNLKILRVCIKYSLMYELEILREDHVKFRLEHPLDMQVLECDLNELEQLHSEIINLLREEPPSQNT